MLPVVFYRTATGSSPVIEWLRSLDRESRREVGLDLLRVQELWPIGMPQCRSLGGGLWEVRSTLPDKTTGRLLFCMRDGEVYALHGFIKKTQKTPPAEIALARKRMKDVEK